MLDDGDPRAAGGQAGEQVLQRLGATGGGAECNDLLGGAKGDPLRRRGEHLVGIAPRGDRQRGGTGQQIAQLGTDGAPDLLDEVVGRLLQEALDADAGLGDDGDGPADIASRVIMAPLR